MSNDTQAAADNKVGLKQRCAALWNQMAPYTTIDRFHENIKVREKSVFLGHVEVTLGMGPLFAWKSRGIAVKLLNGKPHIDPHAEQGSDGKYYPTNFPKTPEAREVITTLIFQNEQILQAMQKAAEAPAPQPATPIEINAEVPVNDPTPSEEEVFNPFALEA